MTATLQHIGFESCQADPDVWMRPGIKPNGDKYWEYVLCYVNDILVISHDPSAIMKDLQDHDTLKEDSVKEPN